MAPPTTSPIEPIAPKTEEIKEKLASEKQEEEAEPELIVEESAQETSSDAITLKAEETSDDVLADNADVKTIEEPEETDSLASDAVAEFPERKQANSADTEELVEEQDPQ